MKENLIKVSGSVVGKKVNELKWVLLKRSKRGWC
jgi:hypothetical protein